ncbi:hypothetical protein E2562_006700, partial [Oryza meyeriana var. granulata]
MEARVVVAVPVDNPLRPKSKTQTPPARRLLLLESLAGGSRRIRIRDDGHALRRLLVHPQAPLDRTAAEPVGDEPMVAAAAAFPLLFILTPLCHAR